MRSRTFIGIASSARPSHLDGTDTARARACRISLLYLQVEARAAGAHLAATLIGAASDSLADLAGPSAREIPGRPARTWRASLSLAEALSGLVECLGLLREELAFLPDPTASRFVDAAIIGLREDGLWKIANRPLQATASP